MSDDRYIDGVHNYCDRWCERCSLTERCRLIAFEREIEAKGDDFDHDAFWESVGLSIDHASEHWREFDEAVAAAEESWLEFEFEEQDEDDWDSEEVREHPLVVAAREYSKDVHAWLRGHGENPYPESTADAELSPRDAFEIVCWYHFQITVKLTRAVGGVRSDDRLETEFADDGEEPLPRDSDGSAKVALLGVERSIGAWTVLRDHGEDEEAVMQRLRRLFRIRHGIEAVFPAARTFVRPGFDDR